MNTFRYSEPNRPGTYEGWFIAFMDDAGAVAILSDYGDYTYRWNARGVDKGIREFLLECEPAYVLSKLARREFSLEKSVASVRDAFEQSLNEGSVDGGEYEDAARALRLVGNEFEFCDFIREDWGQIDLSECWSQDYSGQARAFMEQVWPRLMALVRLDAKREAA